MSLTEVQIERYSRHLMLPEVGGKGQEKLLCGKVLLVGAGGLGCPAGLYLAAAGVGTLGLMDTDMVTLSNLQRQIAHATPDIGKAKVESAAGKFKAINPEVTVRTYRERLTAANALTILTEYDFVIDGTDTFASKFLVADACHFASKPYSYAGILRFDGQTMTVLPGRTACYRCVFNAPPPAGAVPSCSQAGVLGAVAGVMGTLQAVEAVKFLLGRGELLTNTLLLYDALHADFRKVSVKRNAKCPLCGELPTIMELKEEEPAAACDLRSGCRCAPGGEAGRHGAALSAELDLSGVACPLNFVKAKLKLEAMNIGETLAIVLDEGGPIRNVPASFRAEGQDVGGITNLGDGHWRVMVRKKG